MPRICEDCARLPELSDGEQFSNRGGANRGGANGGAGGRKRSGRKRRQCRGVHTRCKQHLMEWLWVNAQKFRCPYCRVTDPTADILQIVLVQYDVNSVSSTHNKVCCPQCAPRLRRKLMHNNRSIGNIVDTSGSLKLEGRTRGWKTYEERLHDLGLDETTICDLLLKLHEVVSRKKADAVLANKHVSNWAMTKRRAFAQILVDADINPYLVGIDYAPRKSFERTRSRVSCEIFETNGIGKSMLKKGLKKCTYPGCKNASTEGKLFKAGWICINCLDNVQE